MIFVRVIIGYNLPARHPRIRSPISCTEVSRFDADGRSNCTTPRRLRNSYRWVSQVSNLWDLAEAQQLADGVEYWLQHPDIPCSGPQMLLSKWVTSLFPAITVQQPGRFYQTVERLELATTGSKPLKGLDLENNLKRTWTQRSYSCE